MVHHLAIAAVLVCSSVCAQRTFVVDAANGPGTSFTSLVQALAQAQHGDVYRIRPGAYLQAASTDKGVTLVGTPPGATVALLSVVGLPSGRAFRMADLNVQLGFDLVSGGFGVLVSGCQGTVHLDSLNAAGNYTTPLVTVKGSSLVSFARCNASASCQDSNLVVTDCTMHCAGLAAGLSVSGAVSRVHVCGGSVSGGAWSSTQASPGIQLGSGTLTLRPSGTQGLTITAGTASMFGVPAIAGGTVASLTIDPAVVLVPKGGAPAISGTATFTALPGLDTTAAPLGGSITLSMRSPPADPYALFFGVPSAPVEYPFGPLFVDLATLAWFAAGSQGATGRFSLGIPVPNDPALFGKAVGFQGVTLSNATSALQLTNASIPVLR